MDAGDVPRARPSARRSARGVARGAAARSGDARRIAVGGARGARSRRARCRRRAPTRGRCWSRRRSCCSITRSSTRTRGSSATSPRRRRRSASSATSSRRRSTRTSARWTLSPAATEIEAQTVRWIAELIGYPADCGGLLVSGGNMANFVCFLAARAAKAGWDVREQGVAGGAADGCASTHRPRRTRGFRRPPTSAGSAPTSIRWIPTDADLRMDVGGAAARRSRRTRPPATCRCSSSARPGR